jgi:hypothetical protein
MIPNNDKKKRILNETDMEKQFDKCGTIADYTAYYKTFFPELDYISGGNQTFWEYFVSQNFSSFGKYKKDKYKEKPIENGLNVKFEANKVENDKESIKKD